MGDIRAEVTKSMFEERESELKHPAYDKEMSFYNLVADGRMEEVKKTWDSTPKSNAQERGVLSDSPVKNAMYHHVAMTTVITRVCISRGMPQDLAYKLSDAYIRKADQLQRVDDILNVQWEMVEAFCAYMSESTIHTAKSKQIIQCVDYIREHIHKSLTVSELAEKVALNETYLSKLFKKEMGCSVSEYIRNEKIEEACWLLKYTDKTSIEIATDLSFSSHSYFISVFKKVTGTTPKEYRNSEFRKLT